MSNSYKTDYSVFNPGALRKRAEDRLKKDLLITDDSQQYDDVRRLYELHIDKIEVELLTEEFHRLRKNISSDSDLSNKSGSSGIGYLILDRNGRIFDAKFATTPPEEENVYRWRKRLLIKCVPHAEHTRLHSLLHEAFNASVESSCELSFDQTSSRKYLGLTLPEYATVSAVADDEKRFCLVVVKDISKQKIAEKLERDSRAAMSVLNKTMAASRNEILLFDELDRRFTFANQRALENLGYTMDDLKSLTLADIQAQVSDRELDEIITYLGNHKNDMRKLNSVHRRKDGSMYPVEIYLQLFEQEGRISFIAIIVDISQLMAIESKLKSIVESAGAIIWAADINLNITFMSNQILDILGFDAGQFIGHSINELLETGFFHESDKVALIEGLNQLIVNGIKVDDLRLRVKHADGTWRWVSINMTPNRSVDSQVDQIVGVIHDIHAQKLAEEELRQLNQELDLRVKEEIRKNMDKDLLLQQQSRMAGMGEMIGNIAHQWRQPINSLGLILSDLEDAGIYGECDLHYIQNAVGKSKQIIQKMSSTIDDFRHFFRVDKTLGLFSLNKVTSECINLVEASMKSNNINITVKFDHEVFVCGYANEYSQAVMNILSNARDVIVEKNCENGEIQIEIGEEGDYGVQSVTDNGGGIPSEILPKIFEPHFTTKKNGVGIGLYMSLVSVEKNMNGKILVENTLNGAKFSMYLPNAATPMPQQENSNANH